MEEQIFLTIAEFAETAGVSKQAVYKRIKTDLAPFCKEVNGNKRISAGALELFKVGNNTEQSITLPEDRKNNVFLLAQLEEKDGLIKDQQATIAELTEQIKALQDHIITQSEATTAILQKQSQLQENFQILLGQQQKQLMEYQSPIVEQPVKPVEQPVEQPVDSERVGLFKRIFGK